MERTTQTEIRVPRWRQLLYCLAGDDQYRRQRQREAGKLLTRVVYKTKLQHCLMVINNQSNVANY